MYFEAATWHNRFCNEFAAVTLTLDWLFCTTKMALASGYHVEYGTSMAYLHPFYVPFIVGNQRLDLEAAA